MILPPLLKLLKLRATWYAFGALLVAGVTWYVVAPRWAVWRTGIVDAERRVEEALKRKDEVERDLQTSKVKERELTRQIATERARAAEAERRSQVSLAEADLRGQTAHELDLALRELELRRRTLAPARDLSEAAAALRELGY